MTDAPLGAWLRRVGARLTREPLRVENAIAETWRPSAPGGYGLPIDDDSLVAQQRTSATLENDLTITVFSALTVTLQLSGLVRRPNGDTQSIGPSGAGFIVSVVGDRVPRSVTFPRGSGVEVVGLTAVVIGSGGVSVPLGSVWAIVQQSRTLSDGTQAITSTLVSGPVSSSQALGWPGSPVRASIDVPYPRTFNPATPVANVNWTFTCPQGARQDLQSSVCVLQNNSAVAAEVQFRALSGAQIKSIVASSTNVPAGASWGIVTAVGIAQFANAANLNSFVSWPSGLSLLAGDQFTSVVVTATLFQFNPPPLLVVSVLERLDP